MTEIIVEIIVKKDGNQYGRPSFPIIIIEELNLQKKFQTLTLPAYQMVAGIYDIMNHITEQYFSGFDDNTSDYIAEGLLRSLIHSSRIAVKKLLNISCESSPFRRIISR